MTQIIKPLPKSHLHNYDDDMLQNLVQVWRSEAEKGDLDHDLCKTLVNEVYAILGYRCALEYIEKYGE